MGESIGSTKEPKISSAGTGYMNSIESAFLTLHMSKTIPAADKVYVAGSPGVDGSG